MHGAGGKGANVAFAIVVWLAVFVATWVIIAGITRIDALGLVWGVFIALAAFSASLSSFRVGLALIVLSQFLIVLNGIYSMFP